MVTHELHGLAVSFKFEKLFDGHLHFADVFAAAEAALTAEFEHEDQAVLLGCGLVHGELHGEVIPRGAGAAVSVHFGFGLLLDL